MKHHLIRNSKYSLLIVLYSILTPFLTGVLYGQMQPLVSHYEKPACLEWNESGLTAQLDSNCISELKAELLNIVKYIYDTSFVLITDPNQPRIVKEDEIYFVKSFFHQDNGTTQINPPHIGLSINDNFEIELDKRGIEGYMKHLISISELGDFTKVCRKFLPVEDLEIIKKGSSHVLYKSTDLDTIKRWYAPYEGRVKLLEEVSVFRQGLINKRTIEKVFIFDIRVFETKDTFSNFSDIKDRYRYYFYLEDVEYKESRGQNPRDFICPPPIPDNACISSLELYSVDNPVNDYLTICKTIKQDSAVVFRKEAPYITFYGYGDTLRAVDNVGQPHTLIRTHEDTALYVNEARLYVKKPQVDICCETMPPWTYFAPGSSFEFFRQRKKRQAFGFNPCDFDSNVDREKVGGVPMWGLITGAWATGIVLTTHNHIEANKYFSRHQDGTELATRAKAYESYERHFYQRNLYGGATLLVWILNDLYFQRKNKRNLQDCIERFGGQTVGWRSFTNPRNFKLTFVQVDNGANGIGFSYNVNF